MSIEHPIYTKTTLYMYRLFVFSYSVCVPFGPLGFLTLAALSVGWMLLGLSASFVLLVIAAMLALSAIAALLVVLMFLVVSAQLLILILLVRGVRFHIVP
jgi:hypothetical protein